MMVSVTVGDADGVEVGYTGCSQRPEQPNREHSKKNGTIRLITIPISLMKSLISIQMELYLSERLLSGQCYNHGKWIAPYEN